jgi:hypothetical protein
MTRILVSKLVRLSFLKGTGVWQGRMFSWMMAVGCWLLAVGCWLLAVGCWLLAVGCWLLAEKESKDN